MKVTKRTRRGKPDPAVLAGMVERIVEAAGPDKIVLFGSAARGTMGPNSDIDLLVIKAGKFNHWRVLTKIYRKRPVLRRLASSVTMAVFSATRRPHLCSAALPAAPSRSRSGGT